MPWSLSMARDCLDPRTGRLVLYPRNAEQGWHGQDDFELKCIWTAWYVERFYGPSKAKGTQSDAEFRLWLDEDFDTWEQKTAVSFSTYIWLSEMD